MRIRSMLILVFLVALGCLQIAGDLFGMPKLKGLAAATQVAPAMKVFTAHQGYETHAARFTLSWRDGQGAAHELALTPQTYAAVRGPYNRRNVYGAALAYGPLLRKDPATLRMQESVMPCSARSWSRTSRSFCRSARRCSAPAARSRPRP